LAHTGPVSRRARPAYDAGHAMARGSTRGAQGMDSGPRLTILLDPARVKPNLAAHRQVGHRCATAAVPVRG
jgi:hypothetical protein